MLKRSCTSTGYPFNALDCSPGCELRAIFADATAPSPQSANLASNAGRYLLGEQLGEGGWGAVYAAEQLHPVRRKIAIKIIKLGMDTRAVVARFQAERQALALMEHENIARVFDAGETADGRPFFAMERVHGTRITSYCDEHRLTIGERLELFMQVCDAVQHAHQKGVVHRESAPSYPWRGRRSGKESVWCIPDDLPRLSRCCGKRAPSRLHL